MSRQILTLLTASLLLGPMLGMGAPLRVDARSRDRSDRRGCISTRGDHGGRGDASSPRSRASAMN